MAWITGQKVRIREDLENVDDPDDLMVSGMLSEYAGESGEIERGEDHDPPVLFADGCSYYFPDDAIIAIKE